MTHKIHDSLAALALPLDRLVALPGNPRVGNVDAIAASYDEFGQLKPIVVRPEPDGTYTIIAGNHQAEAARRLGWTDIAAVQMDSEDEEHAIAFALVDNRVSDLGKTDPELLRDMLGDVVEVYPELFDSVGWDDFEYAALETSVNRITEVGTGAASGYVAPVLVSRPGDPLPGGSSTAAAPTNPIVEMPVGADEEARYVAPAGMDQRSAIVGGSPEVAQGQIGQRKASFQYSLVFDDGDQMKAWWDFLRFLRSSPVYEGKTIAERLMAFIDAHAPGQ